MNLIVFSLRAFLLVYVPVVYRSPSYIVVSKPSGVPMHGEGSLLQIVREQEQLGGGSCHLVHRLDTPTSGLVILPTSSESAGKIARGFQNRERDGSDLITKFYVALVSKKPSQKMGTISGTIRKTRGGSYKLTKDSSPPLSRTKFKDLGTTTDGRRLVLMRPLTGLTHQLRVTLKALGSPIIGDERYGGSEAERLMLHATGIIVDDCLDVGGKEEVWGKPDFVNEGEWEIVQEESKNKWWYK